MARSTSPLRIIRLNITASSSLRRMARLRCLKSRRHRSGDCGLRPNTATSARAQGTAESLDPRGTYLTRLARSSTSTSSRSRASKSFTTRCGAPREAIRMRCSGRRHPIATVHDYRDVLFGGHAPEPDDHLLEGLRCKMREIGAAIGIATDGDADRFGIVDGDGTFLQPNYVIALLFDYLVETRGWKNGVGKSVATTNLINALAEKYSIELHETPVGFKYIGELIKQDKISDRRGRECRTSIRGHVPEKDGVLAGLLCCEMVARRGRSLGKQLQDVFGKVGSFYPLRENFRLTPEVKQKFTEKLRPIRTIFMAAKLPGSCEPTG